MGERDWIEIRKFLKNEKHIKIGLSENTLNLTNFQ